MARNRYDVDEVLETPFDFAHLKRSFVYIKKYKGKMITALVPQYQDFSDRSSHSTLLIIPYLRKIWDSSSC